MSTANANLSTATKNHKLWKVYQQKRVENRMLFPTEGAKVLKVSEFELMLASPYSQYLAGDCKDVLHQLSEFKRVESIVRNDLAVNEKIGVLENLKLGEKMGIAINVGGLDLRIFMWQWTYMLAITDDSKADEQTPTSYSIQFFDKQGRAITKIFLRDHNDEAIEQWQAMVRKFAANANSTELLSTILDTDAQKPWIYKPLSNENHDVLQQGWLNMTDVHQFHFLLKKLDLDRASSYRQAPDGMTQQLNIDAVESLLILAKDSAKPIMIFVGNTGMVQIQTGQIHQIKRMGDWINILDKKETGFTLHLKDTALAQVWCVKRPTKDGIVTCIEGFDEYGVSIFSVFGERQEGQPEREYWQSIVAKLIEIHAHTGSDTDTV